MASTRHASIPFEQVVVNDGAVRMIRRAAPRLGSPVPEPTRVAMALHRSLPGYQRTPLISAPEIARMLGLKSLYVKDESARLGLPSFKVLGASWAVYRALSERLGATPAPNASVDGLARFFAPLAPLTIVAATDGNHGQGVAHVARLLGFPAHILVPAGTAHARIEAIEAETASVEIVEGSYDFAVETAAEMADERTLVVADTGWDGYEQIPNWISEGYATIFWEIEDALRETGDPQPDLVVVQIGVGALARAVVAHYRRDEVGRAPTILGVEPLSAACALETALSGELAYVPGPHTSLLAGLNAGRVSTVAFPAITGGIDAFLAISDASAQEAVRLLARHGITAGETGAAGLAALIACPQAGKLVDGHDPTCGLVIITEGATDPISYANALASVTPEVGGP